MKKSLLLATAMLLSTSAIQAAGNKTPEELVGDFAGNGTKIFKKRVEKINSLENLNKDVRENLVFSLHVVEEAAKNLHSFATKPSNPLLEEMLSQYRKAVEIAEDVYRKAFKLAKKANDMSKPSPTLGGSNHEGEGAPGTPVISLAVSSLKAVPVELAPKEEEKVVVATAQPIISLAVSSLKVAPVELAPKEEEKVVVATAQPIITEELARELFATYPVLKKVFTVSKFVNLSEKLKTKIKYKCQNLSSVENIADANLSVEEQRIYDNFRAKRFLDLHPFLYQVINERGTVMMFEFLPEKIQKMLIHKSQNPHFQPNWGEIDTTHCGWSWAEDIFIYFDPRYSASQYLMNSNENFNEHELYNYN